MSSQILVFCSSSCKLDIEKLNLEMFFQIRKKLQTDMVSLNLNLTNEITYREQNLILVTQKTTESNKTKLILSCHQFFLLIIIHEITSFSASIVTIG